MSDSYGRKSWNEILGHYAGKIISPNMTNKILHPRSNLTPAGRILTFLKVNMASSAVLLSGAVVVAARSDSPFVVPLAIALVAECLIGATTFVKIRPDRALQRFLTMRIVENESHSKRPKAPVLNMPRFEDLSSKEGIVPRRAG